MGKINNSPRYYLVTVCIKAEGFNKILLEGMFVTAQEALTVSNIKKKCWDFLKPQINLKKYNIKPEQVRKDIKIKSLMVDFLLNADI